MKIRNYENKNIIYFILIILIILEIVILIYFYNEKIYKYENIQGTVVKDNLVNLIVTDKQNKIKRNCYFCESGNNTLQRGCLYE